MQITLSPDETRHLQALRDRVAAFTGRYDLTLADTVRYALDVQSRRHNLPGWPTPEEAPAAVDIDAPPEEATVEPGISPDEPSMTPDYDSMTVRELQALADERGLDTSGVKLKAEWIALLEQEA
jgi:hypothetical protein